MGQFPMIGGFWIFMAIFLALLGITAVSMFLKKVFLGKYEKKSHKKSPYSKNRRK